MSLRVTYRPEVCRQTFKGRKLFWFKACLNEGAMENDFSKLLQIELDNSKGCPDCSWLWFYWEQPFKHTMLSTLKTNKIKTTFNNSALPVNWSPIPLLLNDFEHFQISINQFCELLGVALQGLQHWIIRFEPSYGGSVDLGAKLGPYILWGIFSKTSMQMFIWIQFKVLFYC
jgi:hypothetical protein